MKEKRRVLLVWLLLVIFSLTACINLGLNLINSNNQLYVLQLIEMIVWSLLPVVFAAVGGLIVAKQSRNIIGQLLMFPAALLIIDTWMAYFLRGIANPSPNPSFIIYLTVWFSQAGWVFLIFPTLFIILFFPTGRPVSAQWRWVIGYGLGLMFFFLFGTTLIREMIPNESYGVDWILQNPIGRIPLASADAYVLPWWLLGVAVFILICVASLVKRFQQGDLVERQQIKWLLYATGLFATIYIPLLFIGGDSEGLLGNLENIVLATILLGFPISIGIAIMQYRLWDIDIIIRKTLVYGVMIASVIIVYVLVVGYLGFLFQGEESLIFSLTAAGLVAVFFAPVKNYVEKQINRLFFGQRDEPYKLLTHLGQQLESSLDPSSALSLTVETVAHALKLPYVAIALQRGDLMRISAVSGTPQNKITYFPLIYAGQPIGELLVAARAPNESLTPADQRLLADLARQIGMTAHAHLLNANLELARLRLVTERGEARRQLGSDLHDGVGHQLVSLTRQLERTRTVTPEDPVAAQNQFAEINEQLMALTKQVRNLAHQLYPPELELLGLVGAIQERAQTIIGFQIRLDIQQDLPSLPAEIEMAVYYITLEALTNIEKHAQAQTCTICLYLSVTYHLELNIKDDGIGLPAKLDGGLGLLSMQARAAEVGGVCAITNYEGGGTAVIATIPCPIKIE